MQYKKISWRIIKVLAADFTIIISHDFEYILEAYKRHGLCYIGSKEDINAFVN